MNLRLLLLLPSALLAACAAPVKQGTYTYNTLELEFPRNDPGPYSLSNTGGGFIANSTAGYGKLSFTLPVDRPIAACVMVTDRAGRTVLENRTAIHLPMRLEYQDLLRRRQSLLLEQKSAFSNAESIRSQRDAENAKLQSNRAYSAGKCLQPAPLPLPPKPIAKCGSQRECLQDGAAICFSRYLGTKGCGIAMSEFKIPGLLSSPGCAAAAAKLAGEKYDLGNAFVDALHGLAEDTARDLMKSRNAGDVILGAVIGGTTQAIQLMEAKTCTDKFVVRHFAPLRQWTARVEQIKAESGQLWAACQSQLQAMPALEQRLVAARARGREIEQQVVATNATLARLERERRSIEWCHR